MRFKLCEDSSFNESRKKKKDPTKGKMGWFTSFMPNPEKGMEEFNKNIEYNTEINSSDNSSSEGSASADASASI